MHPTNANAVIAVDLAKNADAIIGATAQEIEQRLYAKRDEIGPELRPGLKYV